MSDPIADVRARRGGESTHAHGARAMFDRIAPSYDAVNRLMSASIDRRWRARAIAEMARAPAGPVLDLCAGTMDLASMLVRERPNDRVVAVDFSAAMLSEGRHKAPRAEVVVADATALPFGEATFTGVICGFGMRNLADPIAGIKEVRRVLRSGGLFVTLEFFRPTRPATQAFHAAYASRVLPTLGGWLSGDRKAYEYLADSIAGFMSRTEYERALAGIGFVRLRGADMTFGIASIVSAEVDAR